MASLASGSMPNSAVVVRRQLGRKAASCAISWRLCVPPPDAMTSCASGRIGIAAAMVAAVSAVAVAIRSSSREAGGDEAIDEG